MRILITNDDGMHAEQLVPLIKWARKLGDVTVAVPKYEQSAKSHSIEIHKAFEAKEVELEPGVTVWAVDSSPADCVRLAVLGLGQSFDFTISGINKGYNAGIATHYSGTVGAAMEGAFHDLPSIAASIHHEATQEMLDYLADYTVRVAEQYAKKPQKRATILNINGPLAAPQDVKEPVYAPLDTAFYHDGYEYRKSPLGREYFWLESQFSIRDSSLLKP